MLLIDFGDAFFAFVYATVAGGLTAGFLPNIYGTQGSDRRHEAAATRTCAGGRPPAARRRRRTATLRESHVFEDMMQLVDWIRDDKPSIASAEHARHVIDIIESGYRAAETGQTQELRTTFEPLPLEAL